MGQKQETDVRDSKAEVAVSKAVGQGRKLRESILRRIGMFIQRVGSALIEKDGRFLLIKSKTGPSKGLWNTPGGKVLDDSESFEDCAIRETKEETGYSVKLGQLISTFEFQEFPEKRVIKNIYAGKVIEGSLRLPEEEIEDARWFSPDEISPRDHFTEGAIESIKDIIAGKTGIKRKVKRVP